MLTKVEGERLLYTITLQKELHSEEYIYLRDGLHYDAVGAHRIG